MLVAELSFAVLCCAPRNFALIELPVDDRPA
jgi:hypothetical protein